MPHAMRLLLALGLAAATDGNRESNPVPQQQHQQHHQQHQQQHQQHQQQHQQGRPAPVPCPRGPWDLTGRVPVSHCNATNDGLHDVLPAFQACAHLAAACGAILEVPPGKYWLNGSLHLSVSSLPSRDGALHIEGIMPAQLCRCPGCIDSRCEGSPTVLVGDPAPPSAAGYEGTDGVTLANLFISGTETAVHVVNAAGFRMQDVRLGAGKTNSVDPHGHPITAALSVANSFELSFLRCQFYGASPTRPSVLLRGLPDDPGQILSRVPYVYIVRFQGCMFVKGGVSYVQLAQLDNVASTDLSFRLGTSIRKISKKLRFTEYLGMPLLDVHSIAAVRTFRMELVTIINYEAWDTAPGAPPELPVVSFTGGRANHSLDGITLLNAGNIAGKPAIQMNAGRLGGTTLLDGHWYGGVDVVTEKGASASWLSRSSGGLTFSADERMLTTRRATAGLNGHSDHTLVGGYTGEATARWSLDADGVAQYGDGGSSDKFDTRLERPRVIEAAWDPLPMAAAHSASLSAPQGDALNVSVPSSKIGDLVQVTHEGMGGAMVLISGHVGSAGVVTVVAMNAGPTAVDLPNATLRMLLTRATAL